MAVGRITGPLLSNNLRRDGVDLKFETDLLYLNVSERDGLGELVPANFKVGIKTNTPLYDLDVNGTTRSTNIRSTNVDIGNLNITNNTLSTLLGNITLQAQATTGVIYAVNSVIPTVTDSIDLGTATNQWNTVYTKELYVNGLSIGANGASFGNLTLNGNTISSITDGIILDPFGTSPLTVNGNTIINSTGFLKIPVGDTAQRATPAEVGQVRYNTEISSFEGYGSGGWASLGGVKSVDGLTYITAETSAGTSNDELEFFAAIDNSTTSKVGGWSQTRLLVKTDVTLEKTLGVTGLSTLATAQVSDLTDTRITYAGTDGRLKDSANLTFSGTKLLVTGDAEVTGNLTIGGNITLGNQPIDTITVTADFTSDLTPDTTDTYSLGSTAYRWKKVWANTLDVSGAVVFDSTLSVTGHLTLEGVTSTGATGTGKLVFDTSPTLITPTLGVATATTINKLTITAPTTGATLTIADGKTLTANNTLIFTGTDSSSVEFGAGGTVAYQGGTLAQFASTTSAQLAGIISDETGSGALVFATSPTISSPTIIGHATIEGVTATGATGTGKFVFDTSPTISGTLDAAVVTISSTLGVTGLSTLASARVSDLTSGRLVYSSTGGRLVDSSLMTFNGTQLTIGGNQSISGTLNVSSGTTLTTLSATNGAFSGTLAAAGNFSINTNRFTVQGTSGNTTVAGSLAVTGATTVTSSLTVGNGLLSTNNFSVNTNRFTVEASSGNTVVAGTLNVTGATTLSAALSVTGLTTVNAGLVLAGSTTANAQTFTITNGAPTPVTTFIVDSSTGNTTISGTLNVTGVTTFDTLDVTTLNVSGSTTLADLSSTTGTFSSTLGVTGLSTLATAQVSDLTSGRVTYAGAGGRLKDSANLTFSGTKLTVTGDQDITGNLKVDGNITLGGNITIGDQAVDTVTVIADFTSDLIPSANTYSLGSSSKLWNKLYANELNVKSFIVGENTLTATAVDASITITPTGTGTVIISSNTALQLPVGTTAERSAGVTGEVRFNTDDKRVENFDGTAWNRMIHEDDAISFAIALG